MRRVGSARELPWLISTANSLHPIAFAHPDHTLYLLMFASHGCQKIVSTACPFACPSVFSTVVHAMYVGQSSIVWN